MTRLAEDVYAELDRRLAPVDGAPLSRYPGDPGTRQPVHTLYVPADRFHAEAVSDYGEQALATLRRHGPLSTVIALDPGVEARVVDKLGREPVEDLRIDFEDGYGVRDDDEEDRTARAAGRSLAEGCGAPFVGVCVRSMSFSPRCGRCRSGSWSPCQRSAWPNRSRRWSRSAKALSGRTGYPPAGYGSSCRSSCPGRSSPRTAPP